MSTVVKSKTKRPVNPPINARPNERSSGNDNRFAEAAARLTEIGRDFYARDWVPILENSQDMIELGERVSKTLRESPGIHGFLLKEHGLYTWGAGLQEAKRHVEILEFLMEVLVRSDAARSA